MRKRSRASAFGVVAVSAVSISTIPVLIDAAANESTISESSSNQCVDNPNYVSRFGKLRCEAYRDLNCDGFRDVIAGTSGAGTSDNERRNDNGRVAVAAATLMALVVVIRTISPIATLLPSFPIVWPMRYC